MIDGYSSYGVVSVDGKRQISSRGSDLNNRVFSALASLTPGGMGGGNGRAGGGATSLRGNYELGVLEGLIDTNNRKQIITMCRDMYLLDTISGAAIDLMSNLPFSDFTLSGVSDRKILQNYIRNVENLKLRSFFPAMSIDYLTDGAHQSSLDWDDSAGMFKAIVPHDGKFIETIQVPIHGADPLLNLQLSDAMQKLIAVAEKDPRAKKILSDLPSIFSNMAKGGKGASGGKAKEILLEQASTVYISRRTHSWNSVGISYLYRVLPIWLMEKALIRGTTESVYQRQRAILHITAGDGMDHDPSNEELNAYANLLKSANMDPIGAIIATRQDVNINEIVRGDDFWKWTDINDQFAQAKLKGLGLSDAFLSGDANFSTLEANLSVFIEQLRAFRDMATREFFYEKLFPSIAVANGYKKSARDIKVTGKDQGYDDPRIAVRKRRGGGEEFVAMAANAPDISQISDITEYHIPTVDWHKQLAPTGDQAYLDMLQNMMEKGIPIPIRTIAAAGGQNLDKIIGQVDDDMETRQELSKYSKKIKKFLPKDDDAFGGGGATGEFSSYGTRMVHTPPKREFTEEAQEMYRARELDKGGKPRMVASRKYQRQLEERQNRRLAAAMAKASENNYKLDKARRESGIKNSPYGRMGRK